MGELGEQNTVHGGTVLEDAHGPGPSSDLAEAALDGVGGSHSASLVGILVAEASEQVVKLSRFYWNDQTEIEQALASGEIVAAYAWNSAVKNLRAAGVPVAYAVPKEGILTWLCGLSLVADGEGDEGLVYDYLDAWLSPEAGKFLIADYGYGHPNRKAFEISDPQKVADLGFPSDPVEMLSTGMMFRPYDPQVLEKMIRMFDDVKIGS
ncbi:MAG: extracellular solute-binding protein [Alphaproteobacteria bacterium]